MTSMNRTFLVITLLLGPAFLNAETPPENERGWSFAQRFQGNSNTAGVVLKTSSTATYTFNEHVKAYAGVPIYFARETAASGSTSFTSRST